MRATNLYKEYTTVCTGYTNKFARNAQSRLYALYIVLIRIIKKKI